MPRAASWEQFAAAQPELAAQARGLFQGDADIASAFLATVAPSGMPRLHPVMPVITSTGLWLFIVEMSPKYRDLLAHPQFALHALPPIGGGEELAVQGFAEHTTDATQRAQVVAATEGRQGIHPFERLFHCTLTTVLHTTWTGWGTAQAWPSYEKWLATAQRA